MSMTEASPNFMRGAGPIIDLDVLSVLKRLNYEQFFDSAEPHTLSVDIRADYLDAFENWIKTSKLNKVDGLNAFPIRNLTAGVTQSFDDFFLRNRNRRIRIFRGEYPYVRRVLDHWAFIDELEEDDALIVSAPFSGTGELHPEFNEILCRADELQIPTLVDCAFFGICRGLSINVDRPCVESVCFSLSKAYSSGSFRSGIEFSRHDTGLISVQNQWVYLQLLNAKIGLELMSQFLPDYIFNKYRPLQEKICEKYEIRPSETVIFGIGEYEQYEEFMIDGVVNRCCITPEIQAIINGA